MQAGWRSLSLQLAGFVLPAGELRAGGVPGACVVGLAGWRVDQAVQNPAQHQPYVCTVACWCALFIMLCQNQCDCFGACFTTTTTTTSWTCPGRDCAVHTQLTPSTCLPLSPHCNTVADPMRPDCGVPAAERNCWLQPQQLPTALQSQQHIHLANCDLVSGTTLVMQSSTLVTTHKMHNRTRRPSSQVMHSTHTCMVTPCILACLCSRYAMAGRR